MFENLPSDARLWIFTASRPLTDEEMDSIQGSLDPFLAKWVSHGRTVLGEATFYGNRFLVIAAHLDNGDISGCGIDAATHAADAARKLTGIEWLDSLNVAYRTAEKEIQVVSRSLFRSFAEEGKIDVETNVFDLAISTVAELRNGGFEKPARESWHAMYFNTSTMNR